MNMFFSVGFAQGPVMNDAGEIAFRSFVRRAGGGPSDMAIWAGLPGDLGLVARRGQPAPGAAGQTFRFLQQDPTLNDLGQVAFKAHLDPSRVDGVWLGAAPGLELVALVGDPAPGAPGRTFEALVEGGSSVQIVPINAQGRTAFNGNLDDSDPSDDLGYWAGAPGDLRLLAREGDPAPATQLNFSSFSRTGVFDGAINTAGQVLISATTPVVGNIPISGRGIWLDFQGDLTPVAVKGEQVPGIPGATFAGVFYRPVINDAGQIAFGADLTVDASPLAFPRGVVIGTREQFEIAALEGDPAPGAPGRSFGRMPQAVTLNGAGMISFLANLDDSDTSNDLGLWAGKPGCLQLVVREGDAVEVRPGDVRVVRTLGGILVTGNADGRPSSLNDGGRFVFPMFFEDGSEGIFYTDLSSGSPLDLLADLIAKVAALDADQGTVNSLLQKLYGAQAKLEDENEANDVAAVNQLEAFIHAVMAQRGKKISPEDADELIADAEVIIAALLDPEGTAVCAP